MRRIGSTPQQRGSAGNCSCPDIFELPDGDFAVIGKYAPGLIAGLPDDAGVGDGETIIRVPRRLLLDARKDISELV